MRALRERLCQRQCQALVPSGAQKRVGLPRGMRHRRSDRDGIHYGHECAQPPKAVVGASTRRARCAPYGKGRASGNVKRLCLVAHKNVPVCHEACATGAARATAFIMGTGGAQPSKTVVEASTRRARCAPYGKGRASGNVKRLCLVAHKNVSVCHEAGATGAAIETAFIMGMWARSPRKPWWRQARGMHDVRPTGKAVPAAMSGARALRRTKTCRFATRHAPPAQRERQHSLWARGRAAPENRGGGKHEARTMRALRERPCQHQRRTHMPCGAQKRAGLPRGMRHRRSESDSIHYGHGGRAALENRGGGKHEARTMRALRERPCQHQRRTRMPQGEPSHASVPRGICHRRDYNDGILYAARGQRRVPSYNESVPGGGEAVGTRAALTASQRLCPHHLG